MMEKKKTNRMAAGIAAIVVMTVSAVAAAFYGTADIGEQTVLPGRQAEVVALMRASEPDTQPVERVMPPVLEAADAQPFVTADMPMDLLTESGLYPEQEAAREIAVYDLEHLPEPEPVYAEPVYAEPVWQPAPEIVSVPVQQEPVLQPVYTEDQQEGCVGDGLTY